MGNICVKPTKSSPSNSFTNLKFTPASRKNSKNGGKQRRKSGGSSIKSNGKKSLPADDERYNPPITTGNSLYNTVYKEQTPYTNTQNPQLVKANGSPNNHNYPHHERTTEVQPSSRSSSYKLVQTDLAGNDDSGKGSMERSYNSQVSTNTNSGDRTGTARLEQQLLRGHMRTDSSDLMKKHGHSRQGSSGSNAMVRDRSDSARRGGGGGVSAPVAADFIRKGSWTVSEPKVHRNNSDKDSKSSPRTNRTQPSILTDHRVKNTPSPPPRSAIQRPNSPSMTRSDSCKNEINPVLRNKPHMQIQQRRQVVSAMTINTGLTVASSGSSSTSSRRASDSEEYTTNLNVEQHCACVIKWKKGNLLGRGTFGKVSSMNTSYYA